MRVLAPLRGRKDGRTDREGWVLGVDHLGDRIAHDAALLDRLGEVIQANVYRVVKCMVIYQILNVDDLDILVVMFC